MSNLLSSYLPYLFLLFFLFRSIKDPIYLLGIPFLIFFRYCIFFEGVKLFDTPARLGADILSLLWLLLFWFIFSSRSLIQTGYKRTDFYVRKRINWLDITVICLMVISIAGLFTVLNRYLNSKNVMNEFFTLFSLFFGFFVIKDIVRYINPFKLENFLFSIVVVNSIASLLYFLHQGLHFPIYLYSYEDQNQELVNGELITRAFWFMPVLWFFSIAYLLVFRKNRSFVSIILLGVNFLGIFISYNRSSMANAFIIILLFFVLLGYKQKNFVSVVKNLVLIGLGAVIFFVAVSKFLPANTEFFMGRFKELKQQPADEESNTLVYRFFMTGQVIDRIDADKKLIGMGPVTEIQLPWVEDMRATTADMVWTGVVFRWGYIGLGFFILLYVCSAIKAFSLFMKSDGILSKLALVFLLTIISQFIEGFTSWTFFNPTHFTMGLWYFGMLSALTGFDKTRDFSFQNK